jgi:hypothetical protein
MSYSESSQPHPEQTPEFVSARARRRRALRRAQFPTDETERAELFTHLVRRAFPSYELFVFSFVAGAILGLGYLFNTQAWLVFGILVAPLLTPWIGITLSIVAGALRLFLQTLTAFLISSLIIFGCGFLAGYASRSFQPLTLNEAFLHSRLWWADLVTLTIGAVLITVSFVRSEDRPYLPSTLLAYELFLPLSAAGFGLGSNTGLGEIWPQGLYVFFVHMAAATLVGLLTLFFLRFQPTSSGGFILTGIVLAIVVAVLVIYMDVGSLITGTTALPSHSSGPVTVREVTVTSPNLAENTAVSRTVQATAVLAIPAGTASRTPRPSSTASTLGPTDTPTSTVTAEPTAIIGIIRAAEGGGAFIREAPGGQVLITLANGSTVTIIPADVQEVNGVVWVHVFTIANDERVEGWMIQTVLQTATPITP